MDAAVIKGDRRVTEWRFTEKMQNFWCRRLKRMQQSSRLRGSAEKMAESVYWKDTGEGRYNERSQTLQN